jgi:hypothetical protein
MGAGPAARRRAARGAGTARSRRSSIPRRRCVLNHGLEGDAGRESRANCLFRQQRTSRQKPVDSSE